MRIAGAPEGGRKDRRRADARLGRLGGAFLETSRRAGQPPLALTERLALGHGFPLARSPTPPVTTLPKLDQFSRVVVKVGSSLLVDAAKGALKQEWLEALVDDLAALHKRGADVLVVSSGAIALGRRVAGLKRGALKLEDSQAAAAIGQIALARAWSQSAAPPRHRRRAGAADAAGHRGAPPLSQRARDARPSVGDARRAGHQRERHGGDQRDPLRRQRPARRARRHDGERRSADPALRRRRPLRRAAAGRSAGAADSGGRAR